MSKRAKARTFWALEYKEGGLLNDGCQPREFSSFTKAEWHKEHIMFCSMNWNVVKIVVTPTSKGTRK
jgi:hypothetical protein